MKEIISKIEQWGIERGIDKCDPLMQTTKTLEEVIELQQAILNNDVVEIKDAIGDIFVTLVMLSLQKEGIEVVFSTGLIDCYDDFCESTEIVRNVSNIQYNIKENLELYCINPCMKEIVYNLKNIAEKYNLTLQECVEYAYNEIKDRKGNIIDGMFVKESDL